MRNINSKQQINDAIASGRGLASAPWNIFSNSSLTSRKGQNKDSQDGRSMIEMLGVLAIIGVLSVGGIAGYSKAMQKYRINKTIEQITLIAGNIRTFFAPQKNYVGVACWGEDCDGICYGSNGEIVNGDEENGIQNGCPIIRKAKIVPEEMLTFNADNEITAIKDPFGHGLDIVATYKSSWSDLKAFRIIQYIGKDPELCIGLLTQDWTNANIGAIHLGGLDDRPFAAFTSPASVDNAVEICSLLNENGRLQYFFDIDLGFYKEEVWHPDLVY